ncbi:MAG: hypothetical protein WAV13_12365, partial [Thermodesulfovibrionales bacterium]
MSEYKNKSFLALRFPAACCGESSNSQLNAKGKGVPFEQDNSSSVVIINKPKVGNFMTEIKARGPNFTYTKKYILQEYGPEMWGKLLARLPKDAAEIWLGPPLASMS